MTGAEIERFAASCRGGSFQRLVYSSPIAVDAAHKGWEVRKVVEATVRLKVRYSRMASVIARRGSDAPASEKLPWGEWVPGSRCLISHKGEVYARFAAAKNNPRQKPKVLRYEAVSPSGARMTISEAMARAMTRPSAWADRGPVDVFTVKASNVIGLGKGGIL